METENTIDVAYKETDKRTFFFFNIFIQLASAPFEKEDEYLSVVRPVSS